MGSENDSGSPHSSVSGAPNPNPNPKCRSSKRRRISFQNLFNGKSRSRSKQAQSQQQQQPSTPLQDPLSTGGAGASLASLSDSGVLQTGEGVSDSGVQTGERISDSGVLQTGEGVSDSELLQTGEGVSDSAVLQTGERVSDSAVLQTGEGVSDSGLLQTGEGVSDSAVLQTGEGDSDSRTTLDSGAGERRGSGSSSGSGSALLECPLCLVRQPQDRVPEIMTCSHRSCLGCLRQYLRIEITESRVNISCPECAERLNPHDIRLILSDPALMGKYEEFMLRRYLAANPDCRWCPAPDCGFAVIAYGCASCPKLSCGREGCGTEFCYHCKQVWHPNQTCDSARQQRALSLRGRTKHSSGVSHGPDSGAADDIKPCPRCSAYIIKMNDGSCNHMTCAVCGCEFCWLCMKEISDLHYLSPSGCTFWGRKPWSRKKKILWQLGTLIGAPVGITLIAGIAVPAMIIGMPVYVGKKIHNHYEGKKTSKHKRNLAITGGVVLSVIASPVVAAVSVGIGVPIMLAYVYGVVPISLCRRGGCGVSRANGKGVKIEFDEDDGPITVADAWRALKSPSLGESSLEGLTSGLSASGSPSDGLSVAPGGLGEVGSFAALSGGALGSGKGKYSRLEVQADFLKESFYKDTVSLGTVSDNASTTAMAGSIISSYNPQDKECANLEIQVDIETKPRRLRLASGGSVEELLQSHATELAEGPEDSSSRKGHGTDVTLAQSESIRSDLEASDTQSEGLPELPSEESADPPHA
ncbi:E3 ubiquitin-protein ligase RNF19B isoform X1 [Acipenser ruthenus]|uniref:E3 ubiquitin-protein ligase RNF19B isoform X1 n=1 Tax=Acipenser ruthenus TaxID=7906 RepID=UPI00145B0A80|nr:E3 ubiquitin-protein ligase RNF19B isoform X1 [Acipenser ruthenus]XP_058856369.1 E3 ubiquitin-protein ligase RNF19B isoform X1 [Acipenser ruthenus]